MKLLMEGAGDAKVVDLDEVDLSKLLDDLFENGWSGPYQGYSEASGTVVKVTLRRVQEIKQ